LLLSIEAPISSLKMFRKLLFAACVTLLLSSFANAQTSNPTARKFDEFGDILVSDLIARLDNLGVTLMNEPDAKVFVIVYRTRRDLPGLNSRYAHYMKIYLTQHRVPADRVVIVDGGVASCLWQELWIVYPGSAPKPREDAFGNDYRPEVYKFDEHYYEFESDAFDGTSYVPVPPENLVDYLEAYGETLLKDRKSTAYLISFWDAKRGKQGGAQRILAKERQFLIKEFRISPSRIKTMVGGPAANRKVELWIAQPGYRPVITSYRATRPGPQD